MGDVKEEIRFYRAVGEYGYLSNLHRCTVVYEGKIFDCSEAAYQYGKPKDRAVAEWLINAPKPHLCSAAAHALLGFDIRSDWNDIKVERMRGVLRSKFSQNLSLNLKLLSTGDAAIVEASKTDAFWGIGKKGDGKNMLGVLLMELRGELRKELRGGKRR